MIPVVYGGICTMTLARTHTEAVCVGSSGDSVYLCTKTHNNSNNNKNSRYIRRTSVYLSTVEWRWMVCVRRGRNG